MADLGDGAEDVLVWGLLNPGLEKIDWLQECGREDARPEAGYKVES